MQPTEAGSDISDMTTPVHCRYCGGVYDLAAVVPVVIHADSVCYRTPCCDLAVDDREDVSLPAFNRFSNLTVIIDEADCQEMYELAQLANVMGLDFVQAKWFCEL